MRNLLATFQDGFTSPVVVRGDYTKELKSHIVIGLTHNRVGLARVLFIHDDAPLGAKTLEAHDPWIKDVVEHIRLREVVS